MTTEVSEPHAAPPLVGVEIGGTKLQVVLADAPDTVRRRWRASADAAAGAAGIRRQVAAGLAELLAGRQPRAVGVGFGGPVDVAAGRACRSHQVDGWDDFPLRDWLAGLTDAPVVVENDANVAAVGEAVHGAGRGLDPVFYANFGSGVGGGLVTGGRAYHGAPPGEAEFGHLRLDRDGTTVEDRCSGWAVDRLIRALVREHPTCDLARRVGPRGAGGEGAAGGEARHLAAAVAAGDPVAERVLAEVAGDVAFALSHVVHLFHPAAVVIGGGLSLVGEPLRAAVAAALPGFVMTAFHPVPAVRLAGLGEDAVPVGALELAARAAIP
jgi:glucokinase